jgi:uncharacterized protein (TIGR02246 family)
MNYSQHPPATTPAGDDAGEVLALLARYRDAWSQRDFEGLASLFAPDRQLIYVAEEIGSPMIGIDAVRQYFGDCAGALTAMDLRTGEVRVRRLAPDTWLVFFPMRWRLSVGGGRPLAGRAHVSAVVERVGTDLRFVHYAEAPLGALPFVRAAYADAAEDAQEFAP